MLFLLTGKFACQSTVDKSTSAGPTEEVVELALVWTHPLFFS